MIAGHRLPKKKRVCAASSRSVSRTGKRWVKFGQQFARKIFLASQPLGPDLAENAQKRFIRGKPSASGLMRCKRLRTAKGNMRTAVGRPIEACLLDLYRHLGIEQAHIAAGVAAIADSVIR